jgi:glutamate carboxypeptidase
VAGEAYAEIGRRFSTKMTEDALFAARSSLTPFREGAVDDVRVLAHRPAWAVAESSWLATLDDLGPRGANAHAKRERVGTSSILHRAELLVAFMSLELLTTKRS